jgi:hypothetical protein
MSWRVLSMLSAKDRHSLRRWRFWMATGYGAFFLALAGSVLVSSRMQDPGGTAVASLAPVSPK